MDLLSRRTLLQGGVGLAASTLPLARAEAALAVVGRAAGPVTGLARARFAPALGTRLQMSGPAATAAVKLTKIADLAPARMANDPNCFSLLFQAPSAAAWPQGTYTFRSPELGTVQLFAVPAGSGSYLAVVNAPS